MVLKLLVNLFFWMLGIKFQKPVKRISRTRSLKYKGINKALSKNVKTKSRKGRKSSHHQKW